MKTQLNLPFNNFKCEHMAMQLAFKSRRVRVRLKETPKGGHERHSSCNALGGTKRKHPGTYHDLYLCQLYRNQAIMIGQSLLEFGWLEPVPNARDGGTVFKDEYVLYQPGVVNSKKNLLFLAP